MPFSLLFPTHPAPQVSVCIVQAFVTVSILFRVRTLCPILYFQYILQNSEIICFQTDGFLSVILILSLVTIWQYQKTRRLECILLSCRVCLTNLEVTDETLETFPYLRSTYSDSDLEIRGGIFHALNTGAGGGGRRGCGNAPTFSLWLFSFYHKMQFSDQVWKASIVPAPNFFLLLNNTEINSKDYSQLTC